MNNVCFGAKGCKRHMINTLCFGSEGWNRHINNKFFVFWRNGCNGCNRHTNINTFCSRQGTGTGT